MRRALVVGVNNYQSVSKLRGCVGDVHHVGLTLKALGFEVRWIVNERAHRGAVIERLRWLREVDHHSDGQYAIWLSMHGTQKVDRNGDEVGDSLDECACLYDLDPSTWWDRGMFIDDEMPGLLPAAPGGAGHDMCFSGTGLRDAPNPARDIIQRVVVPPADIALRGPAPYHSSVKAALSDQMQLAYFGASQDSQTAADYLEPACPLCALRPLALIGPNLYYHGALTMAWLTTVWAAGGAILSANEVRFTRWPELTFHDLASGIRQWFADRPHFSQIPSPTLFGGAPEDVLAMCRPLGG